MTRRPAQSIMANPVLVGAVSVLVLATAVFLAYNAHKGLPFVPSHTVRAQLPNGGNLQRGNDVREGGHRIGVVEATRPVRLPGGLIGAEATLKLDDGAWTLPRDTTVAVRGRSVLGLKYLDVRRGTAAEALPENGLIGPGEAVLSQELDRVLGMYDRATRAGVRRSLRGYGGALATRGDDLNRTIEAAPRMLARLEQALGALADPRARLGRFVTELRDFVVAMRPVAERWSSSFAYGADTFAALSASPGDLDRAIRDTAPTLRVGEASLRAQRPLLAAFTRLGGALGETAERLPAVLPPLTSLATTGARALPAGTKANTAAVPVLARLRELASDPGVSPALRNATKTNAVLAPLTRFLGPYVTVCNYFNYAFTHAADTGSEADLTGTTARTMALVPPRSDNAMGSLGAAEPANNRNTQTGAGNYLHQNVYSAAVDRQGNADCESGQRGFMHRLNAYGDPKYKTVIDPHIPGNQGPTFTGKARVPAGQTFTRAPQLGPPMPAELDP